MSEFAKHLLPVNIEDEMKQSYMDYAMSVIVGRALPDVRDGLKPVHRRVLYAMHSVNNLWNRPFVKCARVVGDVLGKYHPHGDAATYEALVRMVQEFSLRYPLIDGQGNFGSIDGDAPAAYRYTECRLQRIAEELLADIDRETVDFVPNYDNKETEPTVLPTRIPNLLVNGSSGIAVGMATNIPPHNLGEALEACLTLLDDPGVGVEALMRHLPGPDFPTGGIILGTAGIRAAYTTGRGSVVVRARTLIESERDGEQQRIVITELPYQVNKAKLLERIAERVKEKKIEGITELRDESDKDGMRVVIEVRRGEMAEAVLNNLFLLTDLQVAFHVNSVALVEGQPRTLDLKQLLECFLRHRREVVVRRTIHDLRKARERAHKLEGLAVALANIDPLIELIKASAGPAEAKQALVSRAWEPGIVVEMLARAGADASRPDGLAEGLGLGPEGYRLSEVQAQEILDLRLQRLTALEKDKILEEYRTLLEQIGDLLDVLARPERLREVVREELLEIKDRYGDARRTEIRGEHRDFRKEDFITEQDVVVTLSHEGYVKSQPVNDYRSQRRGGRGRQAAAMKQEDFIAKLFVASTHDTMLCFSTRGKAYWLKVYDLPQASGQARGKPIVNLLQLGEGERITAVLPLREYREDAYVFMATRSGTVKKCALSDFSRPRRDGIIAVDLTEDDRLVDVALTNGNHHIMLFSSEGKAVRFHEEEVRAMGRMARGVRGMRLGSGQRVIALIIVEPGSTILSATENGFGKRTPVDEYPLHGRGVQGVISIRTSERNGKVVGAVAVQAEDEIMLISDGGTLVRTPAGQVSELGRNTQGVTLITLDEGERLVGIARILEEGGGEDSVEEAGPEPAGQ